MADLPPGPKGRAEHLTRVFDLNNLTDEEGAHASLFLIGVLMRLVDELDPAALTDALWMNMVSESIALVRSGHG
jgi:hypothetical protein